MGEVSYVKDCFGKDSITSVSSEQEDYANCCRVIRNNSVKETEDVSLNVFLQSLAKAVADFNICDLEKSNEAWQKNDCSSNNSPLEFLSDTVHKDLDKNCLGNAELHFLEETSEKMCPSEESDYKCFGLNFSNKPNGELLKSRATDSTADSSAANSQSIYSNINISTSPWEMPNHFLMSRNSHDLRNSKTLKADVNFFHELDCCDESNCLEKSAPKSLAIFSQYCPMASNFKGGVYGRSSPLYNTLYSRDIGKNAEVKGLVKLYTSISPSNVASETSEDETPQKSDNEVSRLALESRKDFFSQSAKNRECHSFSATDRDYFSLEAMEEQRFPFSVIKKEGIPLSALDKNHPPAGDMRNYNVGKHMFKSFDVDNPEETKIDAYLNLKTANLSGYRLSLSPATGETVDTDLETQLPFSGLLKGYVNEKRMKKEMDRTSVNGRRREKQTRCCNCAQPKNSIQPKNSPNSVSKIQFKKTKMCPYFKKGNCLSEGSCFFAHSQDELKPLPDLRNTKICEATRKNMVCQNSKCTYAHTQMELRTSSDLVTYKTSLCVFWKKSKCLNGSKCRFAHGIYELRPKK